MESYRILVVEDEALVAAMIREALNGTKFKVSAVAFDRPMAERYLAADRFDAALLDINLNGRFDGIEIGRLIRDQYHIPFLYLTAHADEQTLHQAKVTLPDGYIVKPLSERDVRAGLEIALYNAGRKNQQAADLALVNRHLAEPLSPRELDVLRGICDGRSNQQIADFLFLSVNTVKTHMTRLFTKLQVSSRTEAIARVNEWLRY